MLVTVEKKHSPKQIEIPDYQFWLFENDATLMKAFHKIPNSSKKIWIKDIVAIKNEDTKGDRINKILDFLSANYSG